MLMHKDRRRPPTAAPAVSIAEAPPGGFLEERLERQWAGASSGIGAGGGPPPLSIAAAAGRHGSSSFGLDGLNGGGAVDSPSKYRWPGWVLLCGCSRAPAVNERCCGAMPAWMGGLGCV